MGKRFKFHSALEETLSSDYDCGIRESEEAVQTAADSGDFDLDEANLDDLSEKIYSNQKYWDN